MELSVFTKAIVNVLTVLVTAIPWVLKGLDVLPGTSGTTLATVISIVGGVLGAVLHLLAPNTTTDPHIAATQSVRLKSVRQR